jgi:hypothetical protein
MTMASSQSVSERKIMNRYKIEADHDIENPCEWNDWEVLSFSRRHSNFVHPDDIGISLNRYGETECSDIGLRRKLDCGTAFALGYYEHGLCSWFLKGEGSPGTNCPWDGVSLAGILKWNGKPGKCGKTHQDRVNYARSFIETYTQYCNGEVYSVVIYDEHNDVVDSLGGIFGWDEAEKVAAEMMGELHACV